MKDLYAIDLYAGKSEVFFFSRQKINGTWKLIKQAQDFPFFERLTSTFHLP